jgi:hypothetical protein
MAVKVINQSDSLETFRTTFNDLAANDFGDKANLSAAISATNLIDAMNETISIATSTAGWTIEDSSSSRQIIGGGNVLRVLGSANEVDAVVSATDTLTLGLPNDVTIANDLTVTNSIGVGTITISNNDITDSTGTIQFADDNLETTGTITGSGFTATGGTSTFGTVQISGNEIRSTDSTRVVVNDTLRATSLETSTGLLQIDEVSGFPRLRSTQASGFLAITATPILQTNMIFEGSTPDDNETTITVTDPSADRTITIPDESGTVITTGSTDAVTESMMANDAIGSSELKSVQTLVIYNSAGVAVKTLYGAGS